MTSHRHLALQPLAAAAAIALTVLAGCGDGGDASDAAAPAAPLATTLTLSGIAANGPLQGATACYDLNDDGACGASEPSAVTDADGRFTLAVAITDSGRHRVVVDVPATAVDKETGAAVGSAFTLLAPASGASASTGATGTSGAAIVATPLSTLVQLHMDATGAPLAAATDYIRAQAGLAVSPLADYTAAPTADNRQAGAMARIVVLATREQRSAVASVQGTADITGATITAADLDRAVAQAVITALPGLAAAVADPAVASASGSTLHTMLASAAGTAVAQGGLSAQTVAAAVGVARLPPDTASENTAATATLTAFRYNTANSWFVRTLESSAADNTPDAAGKLRYTSVFKESVSDSANPVATVYAWGNGPSLARAGDLHWNGGAWVGCPLGTRNDATPRDAAGRSSYGYCDKREQGSSRRSAVDLAGKVIATVLRDTVRTFPGGANGVNYVNWGPVDLGLYGNTVFPAGAKLYYQTNTTTAAAFTYDVQASNQVVAYNVAVGAGGDARSASPACSVVTSANFGNYQGVPATLEDMVARSPGKPCIFNAGSGTGDNSGPRNEWWLNSTLSIGTLAGSQVVPPNTGNYYTTTGFLRVGFGGPGNAVTFFHCLQRRSDGGVRNCNAIGTGTYAIQTLGDARVLSFSAQPALAQRLTYVRSFVERGGKVYYGFSQPLGASNSLRLNLEAANALLTPLGLPPVAPVARASDFNAATAATLATAKGVFATASDTEAALIRFADGGRFVLGNAEPANGRAQPGSERGSLVVDPATGRFQALLDVDSDGTLGTSHPSATATLAIGATQIVTGDGETLPRFSTANSGIVGLWALGSATDLAVSHFAFFANGRVLHVDTVGDTSGGACTQARQGPPGAEYARYSFDAASGALRVFGKVYDTNGCAGLFDSSAGAVQAGTANADAVGTLVVAADGRTAALTLPNEPVQTLHRIAAQ